jgi:hypothetical protein
MFYHIINEQLRFIDLALLLNTGFFVCCCILLIFKFYAFIFSVEALPTGARLPLTSTAKCLIQMNM